MSEAETAEQRGCSEACEGAAFSGIFFGRNQVGTEDLEIELLAAKGEDATGVGYAAAAALIAALCPRYDLNQLETAEWKVVEARCVQS